jgi:RNA polymerase sigma-70 factor (ECF subfamily)
MDQSSTRLAHFIVGRESTPSHNMVRQESARKIAEAIERLPTEQREVVILRYWEEKSLNDVSQALGKSTAAVAGLLHRATKALRKTLKTDPN